VVVGLAHHLLELVVQAAVVMVLPITLQAILREPLIRVLAEALNGTHHQVLDPMEQVVAA
jgi:hypothetical protein